MPYGAFVWRGGKRPADQPANSGRKALCRSMPVSKQRNQRARGCACRPEMDPNVKSPCAEKRASSSCHSSDLFRRRLVLAASHQRSLSAVVPSPLHPLTPPARLLTL